MRRTFTWLPWVLLIIVIASFIAWQNTISRNQLLQLMGCKCQLKVEPLVDTSRTGGVVSYSAAVKVAAPAVVNILRPRKLNKIILY